MTLDMAQWYSLPLQYLLKVKFYGNLPAISFFQLFPNHLAGEPAPKKQETGTPEDVVEDGKIYFLYRPRVNFKEAKSISDIQRFYLVMTEACWF